MPQRRLDLVYRSLADASRDVRDAQEFGYQLVGNWSLSQILEHLSLTMQMTLERPSFQYPALVRPIFRLFFMPTIKKGKPVKLKASAPKSLAPSDNLDESECVEKFHALIEKLVDPATEFQSFHPLLGNLNREEWLLMQKWHAAHHLSFMVPNTQN